MIGNMHPSDAQYWQQDFISAGVRVGTIDEVIKLLSIHKIINVLAKG